MVTYPTETLLAAVLEGYWFETKVERRIREEAERNARVRAEFVEDIEWMASTGETTEGAAARIDVKPQSLNKRLYNAGRSDLWEKLKTNEIEKFGETLSDRRKREDARANPRRPGSAAA